MSQSGNVRSVNVLVGKCPGREMSRSGNVVSGNVMSVNDLVGKSRVGVRRVGKRRSVNVSFPSNLHP